MNPNDLLAALDQPWYVDIAYWLLAVLSAAATKAVKLAVIAGIIAGIVRAFNRWRGFDVKAWIDRQEQAEDGTPLALVFGAIVVGLSLLAAFI